MRNTQRIHIKYILMLALATVVMLALCGCRTRISNNSEVLNTIQDVDGTLTEEYNWRRDDLGMPVAQKPVFKGLGTGAEEDEEYYGDDAETLDDYDYEDYEDVTDEPETAQPAGGGTASGGSTARTITRRGTTGGVRRTTGTATGKEDKKEITVTFDPGDGTCDTEAKKVKTGEKYGTLPDATLYSHDFKGWYTQKKGKGTRITSDTRVKATANQTLYAYYEAAEAKKEETKEEDIKYTVIYTDGVDGETVFEDKVSKDLKEGDATPAFGDDPLRKGYSFTGWSPEPAAKIDTAAADSSHVITYTAKWTSLVTHWYEQYKAVRKECEEVSLTVTGASKDEEEDLIMETNGEKDKESDSKAVVSVIISGDFEKEVRADGADVTIAVSDKAVRSSDDNMKLYLKWLIMDKIYGFEKEDMEKIKKDLDISGEDDELVMVITAEPTAPDPAAPAETPAGE